MRIIGGKHKGIRLQPPRDLPVRPTTDMAKEALFNILQHRIEMEGLNALDLFSGTGGISLELASRGAKFITAVDKSNKCVQFLKQSAHKMELDQIRVVRADTFVFLDKCNEKFDFIFADPPYDMEKLPQIPGLIMERELLAEGGLLVLEFPSTLQVLGHPKPQELRKYGNSSFAIYQN